MKSYTPLLKNLRSNLYPFPAVVAQDDIKNALILNVINPRIGGVLICGEKGTAKSTLVRGLADLLEDIEVIDLPLNITEDRLVGSIDIENALNFGNVRLEPGLLKYVDQQILYIDEVNLLNENVVNILTEISSSGINQVEREGISINHASRFMMVGTMNPEEGELKSQFLDRFGMYVEVSSDKNIERRIEIMKRRLDFENNPDVFCKHWDGDAEKIRRKIESAKAIFEKLIVRPEIIYKATSIADEALCEGHRAEILMVETAKAIAAYDARLIVEINDVVKAAHFVLPHRMKALQELVDEQEQEDEHDFDEAKDEQSGDDDIPDEIPSEIPDQPNDYSCENLNRSQTQEGMTTAEEDQVEAIEPIPMDIKMDFNSGYRVKVQGVGKRNLMRVSMRRGRYVRYKRPTSKPWDIAFDATLRSACLNHKAGDEGVRITKDDIRVKIRESRAGATILFAVDASGSMGASKRMGAVKGAILSLLVEAYQKRDKVGLIAFRKNSAEIILNITRSVEMAKSCLNVLPTGGKTPLALGLNRSYELLKAEKAKNINVLQYLIVVSDGKANVALKSFDPMSDALEVADKIRNEGIKCIVLDTETGFINFNFGEKLADRLGAKHIKMKHITEDSILEGVHDFITI